MKKWIRNANDFIIAADNALPEILKFWVYYSLGVCLSLLLFGKLATLVIIGIVVAVQIWSLIAQMIRDRRAEKARQELIERMANDPGCINKAFRDLSEAISRAFSGVSEEEENHDA